MTKKPFSSQQKKQQLQDKRKKKRENAEKKDDMYDWSKWKEVNFDKEDQEEETVEMNIPKANPLERMGIEDEETDHVVVDEDSDNSDDESISSDDESSSSAAKSIKPREYTSMVTSEFKLKTKFAKDSDEAVQKRRMESLRPLDPYLKGKTTFGKFKSLQAEVNEGFEMIPMPMRPPISIGMTKEQVERQEEVYFQKYLKEQILNGKYKEEELNYFEENVHVWKQLWKTIELSDILFVVADIRHPLFHFPPSLYEYVANVLKKPFILVLNKCDLISKDKQQRWIRWFNEKYPNVRVCLFTRGTGSGKKTKSKEIKLEELKIEKDYAKQIWSVTKQLYDEFKVAKLKRDTEEEQERISKLVGEDFDVLIGECDKIELPTPKPKLKMKKKLRKEKEAKRMGNIKEEESESEEEEEEVEENQDIDKRCDGCVIGFVGHPNVGKSSIINALTGKKVVSTSYTPGHTKHVQTLYLETKNKMIQFCDCPGLVFPAVGASKALQILSGIYPISQVRDPYSIVRYLAERVDLVKLLKLKQDEYDLENDISWSAWTLSEAYARKRGYMTKKNARPDVYRAANELLRRVLKGDDVALILAFDPPSVKVQASEEKKEAIIPSASSQQSNKNSKKKNKKQQNASDFDYIRELERDTFALHDE